MIAWYMLKKILPTQFNPIYNESELTATLHNGSRISLKGTDNRESLLGVGLDGMVIDEFASIHDNWAVWYEILRPMLTDKKGKALFIGTPKGKDSFFELYLQGQKNDPEITSWRFATSDNPFIDKAEIEAARQSMPDRYFKQEYLASFEEYTGLVWPEYSEKQHVIDPIPIEPWWRILTIIDPATSGYTGVLWLGVSDDKIYVIDEFKEMDVRTENVVRAIQDKGYKTDEWYIDPASAARNIIKDGKLYSIYHEYGEYGIYPRPGENDIDAGIERVASYFSQDKLKIFSTCVKTRWELERYHYADRPETLLGSQKPKPYKKDDHLVDLLRYGIMSRPQHPDKEKSKIAPVGSVAWFEEQELATANDWRGKYRRQ